jgi:hypothetical protein
MYVLGGWEKDALQANADGYGMASFLCIVGSILSVFAAIYFSAVACGYVLLI